MLAVETPLQLYLESGAVRARRKGIDLMSSLRLVETAPDRSGPGGLQTILNSGLHHPRLRHVSTDAFTILSIGRSHRSIRGNIDSFNAFGLDG